MSKSQSVTAQCKFEKVFQINSSTHNLTMTESKLTNQQSFNFKVTISHRTMQISASVSNKFIHSTISQQDDRITINNHSNSNFSHNQSPHNTNFSNIVSNKFIPYTLSQLSQQHPPYITAPSHVVIERTP